MTDRQHKLNELLKYHQQIELAEKLGLVNLEISKDESNDRST